MYVIHEKGLNLELNGFVQTIVGRIGTLNYRLFELVWKVKYGDVWEWAWKERGSSEKVTEREREEELYQRACTKEET